MKTLQVKGRHGADLPSPTKILISGTEEREETIYFRFIVDLTTDVTYQEQNNKII